MPGGVVYYAGIAFRSLGLETVIITKAAKGDADEILGKLREIGVKIYPDYALSSACLVRYK